MNAIRLRLTEPSSAAGLSGIIAALTTCGSVHWSVTLAGVLSGIAAVLKGEGSR